MFVVTMKTTRARMVAFGAVLMALVAVLFAAVRSQPTAVATAAGDAAGRVALLRELGYEATPQWTAVREVVIPTTFDREWTTYNALQKTAGYDLTAYQGERVKRYTYAVQMGDASATATLYVWEQQVIAGDVTIGDRQWGLTPQKRGEQNGTIG